MVVPVEHRVAGMVLAGGQSSRMGTAKAALEWHGSTLLRRVLGILGRSIGGPLLVVRAPGQPLPEIPPQVEVVADTEQGLGPLHGIAAGLTALAGRTDAAFVCATDLPFLHPVFVRRVLAALTDDLDVVLPVARGYPQPLVAAYRSTLAPLAAGLIMAGDRRLTSLFRRCATVRLDEDALLADPALATADPRLDSVVNVNSPDDYLAARRSPAPRVTVQRGGTSGGSQTVRAATLSGAAAAVGLVLDSHVIAALNGDSIHQDGELPLVGGDTISFTCADAGG